MEPELEALNSREIDNDIVTVSKLQVALSTSARRLSAQLSELAVKADTNTAEGLYNLMQQAISTLLAYAANWTHVLATSQTIDSREAAEALFIERSDQERSKFSVETLSNVDGSIQRQPIPLPDLSDPADSQPAYLVVTLLLGTADDRPIFGSIHSANELRQALTTISQMRSPYLMVFELLWTPQDPIDVLTEADFAAEFGDLMPLIRP